MLATHTTDTDRAHEPPAICKVTSSLSSAGQSCGKCRVNSRRLKLRKYCRRDYGKQHKHFRMFKSAEWYDMP